MNRLYLFIIADSGQLMTNAVLNIGLRASVDLSKSSDSFFILVHTSRIEVLSIMYSSILRISNNTLSFWAGVKITDDLQFFVVKISMFEFIVV